MIALFTDFGLAGPYVGQLHAALARHGAIGPVIDLLHDAPRFDAGASAHLLSALTGGFPRATVFVGVIDPGVGTARDPVMVQADDNWFVGPANGLFDVVSARATEAHWWRIEREPEGPAQTFHGRDLFAPIAAALAQGEPVAGEAIPAPHGAAAGHEHAGVIYIDPYGNAITGLRAPVDGGRPSLQAAGQTIPPGTVFADAEPGEALWLVNSMGLVEIAVNRGSAAERLGLTHGAAAVWAAA
jgi:S-adenosylmethionine hydrolase